MLSVTRHFVPNDDGWLLHLERAVDTEAFDPTLRPLAIVPGYGMNAFIFGYHPQGTSMRAALAGAGFEVWSLNLRRQGESRPLSKRAQSPSIRAFADVDLPAAVHAVSARTGTQHRSVDLIGCSLGGSIALATAALRPEVRIGSIVAIGSPLRWEDTHPVLKLATKSPTLAGLVRVSGARRLAHTALPLLTRVPALLGVYMNPDNVDTSAVAELVKTVEDPSPRVNYEIACWIQQGDLVLRGVNVSERLAERRGDLLLVVANRDGIVPAATARSAMNVWGGSTDVLEIGNDQRWYSHADLFVGRDAVEDVFDPLAAWLRSRNVG
ncbi:MAG: alpha/beta fold hydrolase [Myxococcales bacterium]|nr:alpha/beta fold hydrolase [Myxococcales bacterium]MCB9531188.1 alpha/beta fold hydrolase [Myxococcales bacterium]MCB9534502.1 alpha/beta fold hydrolase [Myxococcales bacterium]